MSDDISPRHYDDDIDLLDLLETLWKGKFLILASAALPLLIGIGISLTSKPTFIVKAPYSVQIPALSDSLPSRITMLSEGSWAISLTEDSILMQSTLAPRSVLEYRDELVRLNQLLRKSYLAEALAELDLIESDSFRHSRQTEAAATSLLETQRLIFFLDKQEVTPLSFEKIFIIKSKRVIKVSLAAAVAGSLLASVFILLRNAFQDRRIKKGQTQS